MTNEATREITTPAQSGATTGPAPSRRGVLRGVVGALAGAGLVGGAPATMAAAAPHPDAELLAVLAEFDDLEERIEASYEDIPDTGAGDVWRAPFEVRQEDLLETITALRATTKDGLVARARSLAAWDEFAFDDSDGYWDLQMRVAILRDLLGPEECARIEGRREARRAASRARITAQKAASLGTVA